MKRTQFPSFCLLCGNPVSDSEIMCDDCAAMDDRDYPAIPMRDDENGQMAHECAMCGQYCPSVDENGHCSHCRQVWNS